jgi:amino acid transporter
VADSTPDMGASAKSAFTRTASGLVREMSIWDTALFGLLSTGGVYSFVYLYPFPQAFSPGVSVPWVILLTLALGVIVYFAYAGLGSAMPRAGGDYVYETRTVNRIIGFAVPWGSNIVFWLVFPATGAYVINSLGLQPIFNAFGLESWASWLATPTGGFLFAVVVIVTEWYLATGGLRVFRFAQRYFMVPCYIIGGGAILAVFLFKWGINFEHAFNSYNAAYHVTYAGVKAAALKAGYAPTGFNLKNTLIWIVVLAGTIPFSMFAAQGMLGEVKDASNFGRLFRAFLLPGALMGIGMLLIPWLMLQRVASVEFLNQFATAYVNGTVTVPYSPNINIYVQMLAPSKWIVLLVSIGFIGGGFGISSTVIMNSARVLMAMSLDGLLPAFLNKVSARLFTPVRALTIYMCVAIPIAAWFNYGNQSVVLAILAGGMVSATLVVGFSCLGAGLFPFTAPEIYEGAPVRPMTLGRIPVITLFGGAGAACIAVLIYWAVTESALGLTSTAGRAALIGAYGSGFVIYFLWGWYERSRGVDTSLTTREVPPE